MSLVTRAGGFQARRGSALRSDASKLESPENCMLVTVGRTIVGLNEPIQMLFSTFIPNT